jgi:hypothetical protein
MKLKIRSDFCYIKVNFPEDLGLVFKKHLDSFLVFCCSIFNEAFGSFSPCAVSKSRLRQLRTVRGWQANASERVGSLPCEFRTPGVGEDLPQPHREGGQGHEAEEGLGSLFVAGGYAAELLDLLKEVLHESPVAVGVLVVVARSLAVASRREVRHAPLRFQLRTQRVAIVRFVEQHVGVPQRAEQPRRAHHVVFVARAEKQGHRVAKPIDHRVNLGGGTPGRPAYLLRRGPPFPPDVCWCARITVASPL